MQLGYRRTQRVLALPVCSPDMAVPLLRRLSRVSWTPYDPDLSAFAWRFESQRRGGLSKRELKRTVREGHWVCLDGSPVDRRLQEESRQRPVRVWQQGDRDIWVYQEWMYSAEPGLSEADVAALISQREAAQRRQLERAHAREAMTTTTGTTRSREVIPTEMKMQVWQRDSGRCVACGSNENLEFDHIIPVSMGGATTLRNLQLLCLGCNRTKGASLG